MEFFGGRRAVQVAVVAVCALVLSSCFEMETSVVIDDDGTADITLLTVVDTASFGELGALIPDAAGEVGGPLAEELLGQLDCSLLADSLPGFEVQSEEFSDGSLRGVSCTVVDVDVAELNELALSPVTITQDASGTTFELTFDAGDLGDVDLDAGDFGDFGDFGSGFDSPLGGLLFGDLFELRFVVTAPGEIVASNATSTSGSTATWVVTPSADFLSGDDVSLSAQWAPPAADGQSTVAVVALTAFITALLMAVAFTVVSRRRADAAGSTLGTAPATAQDTTLESPPAAETAESDAGSDPAESDDGINAGSDEELPDAARPTLFDQDDDDA